MSVRSQRAALVRFAAGVGLTVRAPQPPGERSRHPVWDGRRGSWETLSLHGCALELARWYLSTEAERAKPGTATPKAGAAAVNALAMSLRTWVAWEDARPVVFDWDERERAALEKLVADGLATVGAPGELARPVLLGPRDPMSECEAIAPFVCESACDRCQTYEGPISGWTGIVSGGARER